MFLFQVENDNEDSGPIHPCCSICMGIFLILLAPYVIWHTEGDYIKTLQVLEAAGKGAVQPCPYREDGRCTDCSLDALRDGQLVFLACEFGNLKTLTDVQKDAFDLPTLAPMVNGRERAAAFKWRAQMYQIQQVSRGTKAVSMDVPDCSVSQVIGMDDDNDPGAVQRQRLCCPRAGQAKFDRLYYGVNKQCQPYKSKAALFQTNAEAQLVELEELPTNTSDVADAFDRPLTKRRLKEVKDDTRRRRTSYTCSYPCFSWRQGWEGDEATNPDESGQRYLPTSQRWHG
ncbi:unnamed protein product [Effrenium voratum]|uniref:Uncharacterized protein n=1 Tax=Effrenium voratum TaxID=2562239 RepID=A0AA36IE17_9DINO|nr:unnamed protein product [Effrenium voratum]CAJ1424315.1 unnamed protein product [Effrenium voratum]